VRAVVFAYHDMGIVGLSALLAHGFEVPMVFSHQDDPEENRWFGSVAGFCRERGIPVHLPPDVNAPPWPGLIRQAAPDLLFSFYYRSLLGREILSIPRLCGLNLHGSLLPRYRGRAPVNWVLVNGETETGVTLHVMEERPDSGDIVGQIAVPIAFEDTALSLYRKLAEAARRLLDELLPGIARGVIPRRPNEIDRGSYFGRRRPEDGRIDWSRGAVPIYNLVRAVTRPYPGAFGFLGGRRCTVWWARPADPAPGDPPLAPGEMRVEARGPKGTARVVVGTGAGRLVLEEIEWEGRAARGEEIPALLGEALSGRFT